MKVKHLEEAFMKVFEKKNDSLFFSPGRMNIIGEHIDYHGGAVLPATISMGTYGLVAKRNDKKIRLYSKNFPEMGIIELSLPIGMFDKNHGWTNYPKGVIWTIEQSYRKLDHGFDIYYYGNIPNGAGLSSSASLQLLTSAIIIDLFDLNISKKEAAIISQKSENNYIGVQCGIMDQFAVAMGKENNAIHLNTNSLEYHFVPMELKDATFLIMNTNKKRGLEDSEYNQRRKESEEAFNIVKQVNNDLNFLTELTVSELTALSEIFSDEKVYRRALHVVSENERTENAVKALQNQDLNQFGLYLNQSHQSLKTNYEVTGIELDTLAETAQTIEGVYGARMTGAGFGGCAIALVHNKALDSVMKAVGEKYNEVVGYEPSFYPALIVEGVHKVY